MQLTQVFVFAATIVASVNALATPVHGVRTYRHSAVAKARAPEPAVSHVSKRSLKKRCKPRTNTSKLILPSGVGNVGNAPETSSVVEVSSTPAPAPSSSSEPAPSSSSEASTSKAVLSTSQAPAPSSSSKASTSKAAPSTSQAPSSTPAPAPSPSSKPAPSSSSKASTSKAAPSTSQAPAPAPTTSQAPAPAPTTSSKASTSKKPTSTSQAPQPTQGSSSSNNSGLGQYAGTLTGQGTWYNTGLTACGVNNNDGEYIAAVSHLLFDTFPGYNGVNPNNNPICGRKASVTYQGKTITVTITDRCEACKIYDLDFTPTAFQNLASLGAGRIDGVSWKFI